MSRDSILDDAERTRERSTDDQHTDQPVDESTADADNPDETDSERVRLTQRMPADLAADVDAVQERYQLPSRNATINFILNHGIETLLD